MHNQSKIYIVGHRGMAGLAINRKLEAKGYTNFITRTHSEFYIANQQAVDNFLETKISEYILSCGESG